MPHPVEFGSVTDVHRFDEDKPRPLQADFARFHHAETSQTGGAVAERVDQSGLTPADRKLVKELVKGKNFELGQSISFPITLGRSLAMEHVWSEHEKPRTKQYKISLIPVVTLTEEQPPIPPPNPIYLTPGEARVFSSLLFHRGYPVYEADFSTSKLSVKDHIKNIRSKFRPLFPNSEDPERELVRTFSGEPLGYGMITKEGSITVELARIKRGDATIVLFSDPELSQRQKKRVPQYNVKIIKHTPEDKSKEFSPLPLQPIDALTFRYIINNEGKALSFKQLWLSARQPLLPTESSVKSSVWVTINKIRRVLEDLSNLAKLTDEKNNPINLGDVETGIIRLIPEYGYALLDQQGAYTSPQSEKEAIIHIGPFRLYTGKNRLKLNGKDHHLTPREKTLLEYILKNPGKVLTKENICNYIWPGKTIDDLSINSLRVYVRRLRDKIEPDPKNPQHIITIPRVGYQFVLPEKQEE